MTRSAIIYSHDSVFADASQQMWGNVASIIEKGDCVKATHQSKRVKLPFFDCLLT